MSDSRSRFASSPDVLDLVEINKLCPGLSSFSAQWFTLLSCGRSSIRLLGDSINVFAMAAAQALHHAGHASDHQFTNSKKLNGHFANLRLLRLRPRLNRNLSSLAIEYLIRNAKHLQYLELQGCKEVSDALFAHWLEMNGGFKVSARVTLDRLRRLTSLFPSPNRS